MTEKSQESGNGNDAEIKERVGTVLADSINPALAGHGGFVRLLKVENSNVHLELGGGCKGCAGARATMRYGVESALREVIPELGEVIDATDHADGNAPFM